MIKNNYFLIIYDTNICTNIGVYNNIGILIIILFSRIIFKIITTDQGFHSVVYFLL